MTTNNSWDQDLPIISTSGGTGQTTYTKGDILYASATNTLSKLAIGTDGYKLVVDTDVPAWVSNAPGSRVQLSSQTASTSATLDFESLVNDTIYDHYEFVYRNMKTTSDGSHFRMQYSVDNGSTYLATGYSFSQLYVITTAKAVNTNLTTFGIEMAGSQGTNTGEGCSGWLKFFPSANRTDSYQMVLSRTTAIFSNGTLASWMTTGRQTTSSQVDAFSFYFTAGNISSGDVTMYGILK